uniref:Uncharacterized protein n=1 Tax=Arundo donax TaxID=35708 RepID=A0A0A8Y3S2_ARUDO
MRARPRRQRLYQIWPCCRGGCSPPRGRVAVQVDDGALDGGGKRPLHARIHGSAAAADAGALWRPRPWVGTRQLRRGGISGGSSRRWIQIWIFFLQSGYAIQLVACKWLVIRLSRWIINCLYSYFFSNFD